jgi:hypothetical protein
MSKFLELTSSLFSVLKNEVELNVANERVIVNPLTIGMQNSVKTAYYSYKTYTKKMIKIIYDLTEFIDRDERPSFKEFLSTISIFDKQALFLFIHDATYNQTFGKHTITCPCGKNVFEDEIKVADVIQLESFTPFDKTVQYTDDNGEVKERNVSFIEYEYPIEYIPSVKTTRTKVKYVFYTHIPSAQRQLDLVNIMSEAEIKNNLDANVFLAMADELVLITKRVELHIENEDGKVTIHTEDNLEKLKIIFGSLFPLDDGIKKIVSLYNEHFSKYSANLYKKYTCGFNIPKEEYDPEKDDSYTFKDENIGGVASRVPVCGREFNFEVSPEDQFQYNFFRKS